MYDLKILWQLNLMKSWTISRLRCLYETNVLRAISILIIRDLRRPMYREEGHRDPAAP